LASSLFLFFPDSADVSPLDSVFTFSVLDADATAFFAD
jgi:hypothetical protein